jgi:hypothetical protein
MRGSLHGTIPGADVSAHADFGEMLGFTDTIFGRGRGADGRLSAATTFRRSRAGQ